MTNLVFGRIARQELTKKKVEHNEYLMYYHRHSLTNTFPMGIANFLYYFVRNGCRKCFDQGPSLSPSHE